jgi:hypothetical protein
MATFVGEFFAVLYLIFAFTAIPLSWRWQHRQAEFHLRQWAERSDYDIVDRSYRRFWRGPFSWSCWNGQDVFRAVLTDRAGSRRAGWVRLGGWFWGKRSDEVEVLWDEYERAI